MTFALRVYQKAYNRSPLEYWGNGLNKSDIVFLETDDQTLYDNAISEVLMDILRIQRNQLLAQTDWRMVSDYPGSNQTEWQTYRQALRDITTQTPSLDSDGNLTGIIWPIPPTD